MIFEWCFEEEDFRKAQESEVEDDIYGWIYISTEKDKYVIDIHKEYYSSKDNGYDMEVYYENDDGGHGCWINSIRDIRSAVSLERFKKRAEKLITKFIEEEEAII